MCFLLLLCQQRFVNGGSVGPGAKNILWCYVLVSNCICASAILILCVRLKITG